jgi:hypothetical protein
VTAEERAAAEARVILSNKPMMHSGAETYSEQENGIAYGPCVFCGAPFPMSAYHPGTVWYSLKGYNDPSVEGVYLRCRDLVEGKL